MTNQAPPDEAARRHRFEALFTSTYRDLQAYALRRCAREADADDLVASVFAVAWRRIDEVPEGDQARLWLFGTARLVRLGQFRSRRRRRRLTARIASRWRQNTTDWPLADRDPIVRAAFASLSDADREMLALHAFEQLSGPEIATVVEISPAAARKRLQRARSRMQAALAERSHPLADTLGASSIGPDSAEGIRGQAHPLNEPPDIHPIAESGGLP